MYWKYPLPVFAFFDPVFHDRQRRHALYRAHAFTITNNNDTLAIVLSDGRELLLRLGQINWLSWLYEATTEQRVDWSLEPDGFAVYWKALDDGIEIDHVLSLHPIDH